MCHLTHTCSVLVIDSRTGKPRAYRARPWPSGSLPANSANPRALSNAPHPASVLRTGILSLPTQNSSFLTRHGTKDLWFKNPFLSLKKKKSTAKQTNAHATSHISHKSKARTTSTQRGPRRFGSLKISKPHPFGHYSALLKQTKIKKSRDDHETMSVGAAKLESISEPPGP